MTQRTAVEDIQNHLDGAQVEFDIALKHFTQAAIKLDAAKKFAACGHDFQQVVEYAGFGKPQDESPYDECVRCGWTYLRPPHWLMS